MLKNEVFGRSEGGAVNNRNVISVTPFKVSDGDIENE